MAGEEVPQALVTVTLTLPEVAEAVTERALVVEVPLQPEGIVQV
jgi:hypothetical protein